jgi:hypothetical protein
MTDVGISVGRDGTCVQVDAITIQQRDGTIIVHAGTRKYEDGEDPDSITQTRIVHASIHRGELVVIARTVSGEGDAPTTAVYTHALDGELLAYRVETEYEGGEPGSTIIETAYYTPRGDLIKTERNVIDEASA